MAQHDREELGPQADAVDAIDALRVGRAVCVDVGDVDGQLFLAAALAIAQVLRTRSPLTAEVDGVHRRLALIFVGNGAYSRRGAAPRWRQRQDSGQPDVRLVDATTPSSTWRALIGSLTGGRYRSSGVLERLVPTLTVKIPGPDGSLARDCEASDAPNEATFSVRREALTVYRGPFPVT